MENNNCEALNMPGGNERVLYVENALVEEVVANNNRSGIILISYQTAAPNQLVKVNLLKLVVSRDTRIMNEFAEPVCFCDLKKGMRINAAFSAAMTRSIPPQARAFQITVRGRETEGPKRAVTTDRVLEIDARNGFLLTGNPYEMTEQMRFVVSPATVITDRNGNRISLSRIRKGQMVRIEHAVFQTASIPPQTTAFRIQVLS